MLKLKMVNVCHGGCPDAGSWGRGRSVRSGGSPGRQGPAQGLAGRRGRGHGGSSPGGRWAPKGSWKAAGREGAGSRGGPRSQPQRRGERGSAAGHKRALSKATRHPDPPAAEPRSSGPGSQRRWPWQGGTGSRHRPFRVEPAPGNAARHGPEGPHAGSPRTSMPLICWRIWHCCPSLPATPRSFSSMAESNPPATPVQKASEPLMNSLERRRVGHDPPPSPVLPRAPHLPRGGRGHLPPAIPGRFPGLAGFLGEIFSTNKGEPHSERDEVVPWRGCDLPKPRLSSAPPAEVPAMGSCTGAPGDSPGLVLQPVGQETAQAAGKLREEATELLRRHVGDDAPERHLGTVTCGPTGEGARVGRRAARVAAAPRAPSPLPSSRCRPPLCSAT